MNTKTLILTLAALAPGLPRTVAQTPLDSAQSIRSIRAVGPEGRGNAEASLAWKILARGDASSIPALLAGMDDANDLAVNWLRSAVETIAAREPDSAAKLPVAELGKFLLETRHHPRARRLAFELIARVDPDNAGKLLPGMLNDPSQELRRDAVGKVIDQAAQAFGSGRKPGATLLYQQALSFARDVDQIEGISKKLKELGQPVDLLKHFGFLTQWKIVGPFDNTDGKGFEAVYPPETKVDLAAEYEGKAGKVRWQDFASTHPYGMIDANKPCGALKSVAAYAYTEFASDKVLPVELRLGCKNGWKIWFNGKFIFGRDEYHRMTEIDHFRLPVTLQPGHNNILVKVCQNEQVEDWTKEWEFQLRVTDSLGTPIPPVAINVVAEKTPPSGVNERRN